MELKRYHSTRAEKVSDRVFQFVISDESVDRHRTVIKMDGWQLENYRNNPIVAYQHNTFSNDPDSIVGKGDVYKENGKLMARVTFEPEGDNPIADKLVKKIEFGSINATSVGFNPIDWSRGVKADGEDPELIYFRNADLLEFSIVHIPSNPNATQDKDFETFIRMINEESPLPETKPVAKGLDEHKTRLLRLKLQSL